MPRSIERYILGGTATFLAIIVIAVTVAIVSLQSMEREGEHLIGGVVPWVEESGAYDVAMVRLLGSMQTYLVDFDAEEIEEAEESLLAVDESYIALAELEASDALVDHSGITNLASLQERRAEIRSDAVAILAELKSLDGEQGGTLKIFDEIEALEDSLSALNADQQQMREEATADVSEEISAAFLRTLTTVLVASVIVTGMVVGLYFWIRSVMVRPVQALSRAAEQIGAGNYAISIQAGGVAEVGELQRSFTEMAALLGAREASLAQQVTMIQQAHDQAQRAEQRLTEQLATIERQSETIREMSIPLLPMGESTLVMPLVGILDEARLEMMQTQALERVSRQRTDVLILDVTGVPIIDSQVAQGLISITQSARLLGTKAVLVGIRPEVAQTIVGLGIALDEMSTFASLQDAIRATLRSRAN